MVWTKSARGDKRLAGETKESVTRERGEETNLPFLQWRRKSGGEGEWYFGGVEKVLRAGDCASLSGTLDSHICYAVAWRHRIFYHGE